MFQGKFKPITLEPLPVRISNSLTDNYIKHKQYIVFRRERGIYVLKKDNT